MIIGVDEVGRGCWAGPVVAGAVLLARPMRGLRDSKKLTKQQRTVLAARIRKQAVAYGIGWVPADELDRFGLTEAVRLAMRRAVAQIAEKYEHIIIDGNYNYLSDNAKSSCLVRADDTVPAVSAASILAKVARDTYMQQAARHYPGYAFEQHVGYGTRLHQESLRQLGASPLHRFSFAPLKQLPEM